MRQRTILTRRDRLSLLSDSKTGTVITHNVRLNHLGRYTLGTMINAVAVGRYLTVKVHPVLSDLPTPYSGVGVDLDLSSGEYTEYLRNTYLDS